MISSIVHKFSGSSNSSSSSSSSSNSSNNTNSRRRSKSVTPTTNSNFNSNCATSRGGVGLSPLKSPFFKYRKHSQSGASQVNARVLKQQMANFADVKPTPKLNYSSFMYATPPTKEESTQNYENAENCVAQSLCTTNGNHNHEQQHNGHHNGVSHQPVVTSSLMINNGYNHSQHHHQTKSNGMEIELEKINLKQQPAAKNEQLLSSTTAKNHRIHADARFADEPEYRMEHPRRGYGVIINNKYFDTRLELAIREGTDRDAASLESSLRRLGFDTKLFNNCTAACMRDLLIKYAQTDHWDADCFACVILTHGDSSGVVYACDKELDLDTLVNPFKYNRSLAGKPKLFVVQACRGSRYMEGIDSNPFAVEHVSRIPMEADFLVAYSTVAGYYSWRNSHAGSWFIQSLCTVLDEYGAKLELMQLLTAVNRRVAYFYESNTDDPALKGKKQVPCVVSMLTKELYFKPKNTPGSSISIAYN